MANIQSCIEDARYEEEEKKYRIEHGLISEEDAEDIAAEKQLVNECENVVKRYHIENYIDKEDEWNKLSEEEKLLYCFSLLSEIKSDSFPLLRQVDVFQMLINIDFEEFNYYRVLECAFFDAKYDGVNVSSTIIVPYNPLIPIKYYTSHLNKLKKESGIGHLNIPETDTTEYLQRLLRIWFLHKSKNYTAYRIADLLMDESPDNQNNPKAISRSIKAISKLYSPQ